MVKITGPLASHHASGRISAPRIYSSSLRNRHDREAPPAPPPPTGGSLLFTDTTNHCSAPTINHPNQTPGTLESWVNPTNAVGYICGTMFDNFLCGACLFWFGTNFYAYLTLINKMYYTAITNPIPTNQWTHVACTWQTGLLTLWVAGQNVKTSTGFSYSVTPKPGFHVGGKMIPAYSNLEAYVTRTRFSDIVRYSSNFTPDKDFTPDANTIGLWRMTEGAGTTVADESSNGHTLNFPGTNQPTWSDLVP